MTTTINGDNGAYLNIDMWYGNEFVAKRYGADSYFNDNSATYWGWIYDENGKRVGSYESDDSVLVADNFQIDWDLGRGDELRRDIRSIADAVNGATAIQDTPTAEDFADDKVKFFFNNRFLGSCDPDNISCPKLRELMENDTDGCASQILMYLNSLGDYLYTKAGSDEPEDDVGNVDIDDLYNTFMQELDYEYRDFPNDFYVGGSSELPDFEIFVGPVNTENVITSSTNITAATAPEGGYLYIFKHGIGPGTIPDDVNVVRVKDLPNYYTAVWLDRFLTTDELKQYDIPSETRINELLGRIGYCQKNGDVVPCDEVEACDVTASTTITAATSPNPINTVVYRLPNGDCYGYADSGKKIESSCWDWCCMDIIIQNLIDQSGVTEDEGVAMFWNMVHDYDPAEFDDCVEPYGGDALECIGDGNPGLNELRTAYLESLGFTEVPADQDVTACDSVEGATKYSADMCSIGASDTDYDSYKYVISGCYYDYVDEIYKVVHDLSANASDIETAANYVLDYLDYGDDVDAVIVNGNIEFSADRPWTYDEIVAEIMKYD